MKTVVITFDDGRNDNYNFAFKIMSKYGLKGTIFCTTGFIDGTWQKKKDWYSAEQPLSLYQLTEMHRYGWEIATHGDRHITKIDDTKSAISKLHKWGLSDSNGVGFSIPDSKVSKEDLKYFISNLCPLPVKYIRCGRNTNTKSIFNRFLFFFYTYLNSYFAYEKFNKPNVVSVNSYNRFQIPSIVVRFKDSPKKIIKFIKKMPNDSLIVLMFHSILPNNSNYYGADPWNWENDKMEMLCCEIKKIVDNNEATVCTLSELIQKGEKRWTY